MGEPAPGIALQPRSSVDIGFPVVQDFGNIPQQTEPIRREQPAGQPQRQGYFTSILSSLPNLSLSSITGDTTNSGAASSAAQQQSAPSNPGGPQDPSSYGFSQNPYGAPSTTGPFVAVEQQGFGDIGLGLPPNSSPKPPLAAVALPPSGGELYNYVFQYIVEINNMAW